MRRTVAWDRGNQTLFEEIQSSGIPWIYSAQTISTMQSCPVLWLHRCLLTWHAIKFTNMPYGLLAGYEHEQLQRISIRFWDSQLSKKKHKMYRVHGGNGFILQLLTPQYTVFHFMEYTDSLFCCFCTPCVCVQCCQYVLGSVQRWQKPLLSCPATIF